MKNCPDNSKTPSAPRKNQENYKSNFTIFKPAECYLWKIHKCPHAVNVSSKNSWRERETTKVISKFVILEGDSEAPSRGILVAKELIDTGRDVIPVRVVNLYDSARAIKEGSCLGNAEPALLIKRNHPVMQKSKRTDNVPDHLQQVWEETKKEL
ncbi:hypothetical protein LAZ67_20001762 [Cordylochernes scorpioides]|uniref:Toprim domain-containing protein n=1 Tax=Cordylochernes scorpioides TaxID=51811 RepID=A0ABY6LM00_9ARAC|nr:hypothetical protein LAZ67_20001762 [Cordylochernes scorpioides]